MRQIVEYMEMRFTKHRQVRQEEQVGVATARSSLTRTFRSSDAGATTAMALLPVCSTSSTAMATAAASAVSVQCCVSLRALKNFP